MRPSCGRATVEGAGRFVSAAQCFQTDFRTIPKNTCCIRCHPFRLIRPRARASSKKVCKYLSTYISRYIFSAYISLIQPKGFHHTILSEQAGGGLRKTSICVAPCNIAYYHVPTLKCRLRTGLSRIKTILYYSVYNIIVIGGINRG